jgi:hypothetical protein
MTQILAIEWTRREARCVIGAVRGQDVQVAAVESIPLSDDDGAAEPAAADVGARLAAALGKYNLGR